MLNFNTSIKLKQNKMKKYIKILFIGILFFTCSCTDEFEEINTNPNKKITVPARYIFGGMSNATIYANYQRKYNLFDDLYSQYFANAKDEFKSGRYEYVNDWAGNHWKEFYTYRLDEYNNIMESTAGDPTQLHNRAIAEILICYMWGRLTDKYGDVPYYGVGEGVPVPFNNQSEIYPDLINRLEIAVNSLSADNEEVQLTYGDYDALYKGDIDKWIRFGNSLRLRMAMRMSEVNPALAATEVAAAITAGVMISNDDVAKTTQDLDNVGYDYLNMMGVVWGDLKVSKTFTDYLNVQVAGIVDPRAPIWFIPAADGSYTGLENGYDLPRSIADYNTRSTINIDDSAYHDFATPISAPVMFYSEVLFLQAEAALRGWAGGDANALYINAIEASMEYVGVEGAVAEAYIAQLPTISSMADLEQLITQKWIANFPNGIEGWADYRRTDMPKLAALVDGVSGAATVAAGGTVKRVRYPDNEHDINAKNMPEGLNTYESDRMDVRVWWDVK